MVAAVLTAAALAGARVPVKIWLAFAAAPLGFLLVGAFSLAVQLDTHGLGLAPGGVLAAVRLVERSFAALTCLLFLALTTPATDLIAGLRRLGLPPEIAELALLMYRFLFLLADTAMAMDTAQAARLGHVGAKRRLRSLGGLSQICCRARSTERGG
jgi:cobalt/nickel transport system permease protein